MKCKVGTSWEIMSLEAPIILPNKKFLLEEFSNKGTETEIQLMSVLLKPQGKN